MRRVCFGLIVLIMLAIPFASLMAASAPQEINDFTTKTKDISLSKYEEKTSLVVPEKPLSFEADIPYTVSLEDKTNGVEQKSYVRLSTILPGGATHDEINLKPGEKKSGTIHLVPGQQLKVDVSAGMYKVLFIKSGAEARCKITWPEFRFVGREQMRRYDYVMSAAGWANVDRWSWDFGDGQKASGAEVEHVYAKPGSYKMSIVGYQGNNAIQTYTRTMVVPDAITVNPQVSPTDGAQELTVKCQSGLETHYGEDAECSWDFGDGSQLVIGNEATHVYKQSGRYRITMNVRSLTSNFTVPSKTWNISVRPITVTANASITPQGGSSPLKVVCLAQPRVDGSPVDLVYRWSFGDGNYAEGNKVTHWYGDVGAYQITLQITDKLHPELVIQPTTFNVKVDAAAITVTPAANPMNGPAPLTVLFVPGLVVKGYAGDLTYLWDFGDGANSSEPNPLHTYRTAGEYTARLTVRDAKGTQTQGTLRISVSPGTAPTTPTQPQTGGTYLRLSTTISPVSGRTPLKVYIQGQFATDFNLADLSFFWDFGDGSTDTTGVLSLTHTYQYAGRYYLKFWAKDKWNNVYSADPVLITVS